jgi:predicted HD phosphohydrolase
MMARAGYDEEDVVVGLLHDVAFVVAPDQHGAAAAQLLKQVTSERNHWMLENHALVGERFLPGDRGAWRELRHHEHFAWTEEFVERFDLRAIDPLEPIAPLEEFEPTVDKVFASRLGEGLAQPSGLLDPDKEATG